MAKKTYAEKFLSSMVSQVGRDLGKVISNVAFKDAHATPVRRVMPKKEKPVESPEKPKPQTSPPDKTPRITKELTRSILGNLIQDK